MEDGMTVRAGCALPAPQGRTPTALQSRTLPLAQVWAQPAAGPGQLRKGEPRPQVSLQQTPG